MAEALVRLKEYGARMSVFDIEYIDESPTQIDEIYLKRGLRFDFDRGITEIKRDVSEIISAYAGGSISRNQILEYQADLLDQIQLNGEDLYLKTLSITRNNDEYLAQGAALFGHAWGTLNLQNSVPLEGEQAERRLLAEERFSYPVKAGPLAPEGANGDILPPIPSLMQAIRGAGFTNVVIDEDGIRRRIYLARKVKDQWYLQLAFAPIVEYLGNPSIELEPGRLTIRNARYPEDYPGKRPAGPVNIVIPLDSNGAMLLDWPKTDYFETNTHLSFAMFSYLEEYQSSIKEYLAGITDLEVGLFPALVMTAGEILETLETADALRDSALEQNDDELFNEYVDLRDEGYALIRELLDMELVDYIRSAGDYYDSASSESLQYIESEIEFALTLVEYLDTTIRDYDGIHNALKESLAGKICIIGRVDTGTTDIGVNPFFGEYINVGTHGVVMDTVLSQSFITPLPSWWSAILCLVLVPLIAFAVGRCSKAGLRLVLGIAAALVIVGASFVLFRFRGVFLGPLAPALALAAAVIVRETLAFMGSERDKVFYRKAFATYTSEAVAEQIAQNPSLLQLGGSTRYMTAVFTDIQGFTSISQALTIKHGPQGGAEALVKLLNQYLTAMSDLLLEQEGVIDKYEGDAIISFFGAPQDLPDHALRACTSAVLMKRKEDELNPIFLAEKLSPYPLRTRIGINTGSMVVGNMGTEKKMDYTIMGNTVNLAARLESVNKQYGTWILTGEDTIKETGDALLYRYLDRVRVVGIDEPVRLCEILELNGNAPGGVMEELKEKTGLFNEALVLFEDRDWDKAQTAFEKVLTVSPDDGPTPIFIKWCEQYKKFPPAPNWDGVRNLDQK
jgi:adenylate cyclase